MIIQTRKKTKQIPKRADFFNKFNSLNSDWNIFTDGSKIPNNPLTGLSLFAVNKDESRCVALSIKARKLSVPDAEKLAILIAIQMAKN